MDSGYELTRETAINEKIDYSFKVVLAGKMAVGKTSLMLRISKEEFKETYVSTIAGNSTELLYRVKEIQKNVRVELWDTSGEERYLSVTKIYFKGAHAVLLLYDITDKQSLSQLVHWRNEVNNYVEPSTVMYMVGAKSDLMEKRMIALEEAEDYSKRLRCPAFEVSSKTGDGVKKPCCQLG
eukprot:TRINITY_DN5102_c0_g1_i2.p1 TRINITY_DN5102_c0_g1~~TRINITY_DN5102_c0_g1_i2.p1  ORF type:complete len:181 (-),score=32.82 TRINITY_DN5102_c0_g1_i2:234-776(-)